MQVPLHHKTTSKVTKSEIQKNTAWTQKGQADLILSLSGAVESLKLFDPTAWTWSEHYSAEPRVHQVKLVVDTREDFLDITGSRSRGASAIWARHGESSQLKT